MIHEMEIWKCAAAGNLASLTEMAHQISGCDLLLGDPLLNILAETTLLDTKDWNWERYIQEGYAPDFGKSVHFPKETRMIFAENREGWLGHLPDAPRAHLLLDLHTPKEDCYHLVISSPDIQKLQEQLTFFDIVSQALLVLIVRRENELNHNLTIEHFLNRLLEEDLNEAELIESRARLINFPTEGYFSLLTIDIGNFRPKKDSLATITSYLMSMADSASVIHGHYLVILQNFPQEHMIANPKFNTSVRNYLYKNGLTAARSRAFFLLRETRIYFEMTLQMLRLRHFINQTTLVEFPDLIIYMIADNLPAIDKCSGACHPFVRKLAELDKESRSGYYIETLKAYLKCSQRAVPACEMLHIHRNTLDYRLRKIEEQVPIDWGDGDMMLQVYFSIYMMELIGEL